MKKHGGVHRSPASRSSLSSVTSTSSSSVVYELAKGWKECRDDVTGDSYYYNDRGEVSWERPVGVSPVKSVGGVRVPSPQLSSGDEEDDLREGVVEGVISPKRMGGVGEGGEGGRGMVTTPASSKMRKPLTPLTHDSVGSRFSEAAAPPPPPRTPMQEQRLREASENMQEEAAREEEGEEEKEKKEEEEEEDVPLIYIQGKLKKLEKHWETVKKIAKKRQEALVEMKKIAALEEKQKRQMAKRAAQEEAARREEEEEKKKRAAQLAAQRRLKQKQKAKEEEEEKMKEEARRMKLEKERENAERRKGEEEKEKERALARVRREKRERVERERVERERVEKAKKAEAAKEQNDRRTRAGGGLTNAKAGKAVKPMPKQLPTQGKTTSTDGNGREKGKKEEEMERKEHHPSNPFAHLF